MSIEERQSLINPDNGNDAVYLSINNVDEAPSKKKDKKKKNKNKDNQIDLDDEDDDDVMKAVRSKYDMKNHMANERTFFKYLFTGLHIGGIGTLVLSFFSGNDIWKLYLVSFIWAIAFGLMFWGLYSYYHRKYLMETGHFKETELLNPHTPALITVLFIFVIGLVILYGCLRERAPSNNSWRKLFSVGEPVAHDSSIVSPVPHGVAVAPISSTHDSSVATTTPYSRVSVEKVAPVEDNDEVVQKKVKKTGKKSTTRGHGSHANKKNPNSLYALDEAAAAASSSSGSNFFPAAPTALSAYPSPNTGSSGSHPVTSRKVSRKH